MLKNRDLFNETAWEPTDLPDSPGIPLPGVPLGITAKEDGIPADSFLDKILSFIADL